MIRVHAARAASDKPSRISEVWRKTGLAGAMLVVCEIGARIVAPGINAQVLRDFLHGGSAGWMLRVYDWLVSGALSRGAILGIGIMPYLSARIMMRLAHVVHPEAVPGDSNDPRVRRWTRWLTGGLAMAQACGYATFLQGIPGAVTDPGFGFLARTMAVLTAGSLSVAFLSEKLTERHSDEVDDVATEEKETIASAEKTGDDHLLGPAQAPESELYRPRDRDRVRRDPAKPERTDD